MGVWLGCVSGFVKLDGAAPKAGKVQGRYPVRPAFGRYTPGGGQRVPMIRPVPPSTARATARGHRRRGEENGSSATARRQHDRKKREGRHERRKSATGQKKAGHSKVGSAASWVGRARQRRREARRPTLSGAAAIAAGLLHARAPGLASAFAAARRPPRRHFFSKAASGSEASRDLVFRLLQGRLDGRGRVLERA